MTNGLTDAWKRSQEHYRARRDIVAAALDELRLPPIPSGATRDLDRDGYVILGPHLSESECDLLGSLVSTARDSPEATQIAGGHHEPGVHRLNDLFNLHPLFAKLAFHPPVLSLVAFALERDFHLSAFAARSPRGGSGAQNFHRDWHTEPADGSRVAVNVIWALDDFTTFNGAPEVLPSSHRWRGSPTERELRRGKAVTLSRGSAVLYDAHLWHRGTANESGDRRVGIHVFFTRICYPQRARFRDLLSSSSANRLASSQRALLDL